MQKITFQNSEEVRLVGVLHTPEATTKSAVAIAHGFTSNKDRERLIQVADALADADIAALRFDFGGSGESDDREITIAAQIDDLQSAVGYLKEQEYEHIGLLGESLGGITALKAYGNDIEAMVLWAPVTKPRWTAYMDEEQKKSLEEKGYFIREKDNRQFKIPQAYVDERTSVDQAEVLGKIEIPVMIVHGTADDTVLIEDSQKAVDLLPEGSILHPIENASHTMKKDMDKVIPKTVDWFKEHLVLAQQQ